MNKISVDNNLNGLRMLSCELLVNPVKLNKLIFHLVVEIIVSVQSRLIALEVLWKRMVKLIWDQWFRKIIALFNSHIYSVEQARSIAQAFSSIYQKKSFKILQ